MNRRRRDALRKETEKTLKQCHETIRKLRIEESNEANRKLIRQCFKCRNSYGVYHPTGKSWWVYLRIIGMDAEGEERIVFKFQKDCDGQLEITPNNKDVGRMPKNYKKITYQEFIDAWEKFRGAINGYEEPYNAY